LIENNPLKRIRSLNSQGYGGYWDWELLYSLDLGTSAGDIESLLHSEFHDYKSSGHYLKNGAYQNAREMFELDAFVVIDSLKKMFNL
jgi:hypothetical protein